MAPTTGQLLASLGGFDCTTALAGIFDDTWIGVLIAAVDGRVVYANAAYGRMSGYIASELLSLRLADVVHADDLAAFRQDPEHQRVDVRHVRRDGTILRTTCAISLHRDKVSGAPLFLIVQVVDLADQHAAIARALEEKERLAVTLRSMADAVICTDGKATITFMNPAAELFTGWSAAEAAGRPVTGILNVVEDETSSAVDPVGQCLRLGTRYIRERGLVLITRSGGTCDIGLSVAPLTASGNDIAGSVILFNDVTEVRAQEKKAAHGALHDELTGLANRANFLAKLKTAVHRARGDGRTHALCFIDLDHFKAVNDRGGHAAGDALLSQVAAILSRCCTERDVAARLGGDEFALLMSDCTPDQAATAATRIIHVLAGMDFRWQGRPYRIGASIGLTMITRNSPELGEILHQADKACYAAKESGRGRVCVYDDARRLHLETFRLELQDPGFRRMNLH